MKIVIPKKGKNVGNVIIEGMEHDESCHSTLEEVAVGFGKILSQENKSHFDDDAPVHDKIFVN